MTCARDCNANRNTILNSFYRTSNTHSELLHGRGRALELRDLLLDVEHRRETQVQFLLNDARRVPHARPDAHLPEVVVVDLGGTDRMKVLLLVLGDLLQVRQSERTVDQHAAEPWLCDASGEHRMHGVDRRRGRRVVDEPREASPSWRTASQSAAWRRPALPWEALAPCPCPCHYPLLLWKRRMTWRTALWQNQQQ
ncbi:hypothetical protein PINS_up013882 [Pythium insidiosum]|nr:hypothetical protein PINS_up013882 [Pythium insidiosum]